jgi:shikimate kinase
MEEQTIREIFETEGEDYFRKKEAAMLRLLKQSKTFVAATGGGTPCFHDNMDWMNHQGITIWIDEPVSVLVQRLQAEKSHRPLISNLSDDELASYLQQKLSERKPFYIQATHHLEGKNLSESGFKMILQAYA